MSSRGKRKQMDELTLMDGAISFAFEEDTRKRRNRISVKCYICDEWLEKGKGRKFLAFAEFSIFLCGQCVKWIKGFKHRWAKFQGD